MKIFCVYINSLFAFLVLNGNCSPVEQVSVLTRYEVGEITREISDSSTTETSNLENDFTHSQEKIMMNGPTNTTEEMVGFEAPISGDDKKLPNEDCNENKEMIDAQTQDYDKNFSEGTTGKQYRFFTFIDGKTKREIQVTDVGEGLIQVSTTENNDKEVIEAESDFIQHDYDYTVKNDYEKRKKREERIKRLSVEYLRVPYILPNRNRRDFPAYPADLVPGNEKVTVTVGSQEEEGKIKEEEEEEGDIISDDINYNDNDEKKEKEKECVEEIGI